LNTLGGPASVAIIGVEQPEPVTPPTPEERKHLTDDSYTSRSLALDVAFDDLPLARQLVRAARAMENARGKL
jgi:hypothetical protein